MQLAEIDQNKSAIFKRPDKKLVIRVHMNRFEEANPLKRVYLKQKKTARLRSKSKSTRKKRSPSIRMFLNAHKADQNETFLMSKKLKKQLSDTKSDQIFKISKSRQKIEKGECNLIRKGTCSAITAKINAKQLEHFIQKIHKSAIDKKDPPKDLMSQLSKIIYGQEGAHWQDRSFEFIEESSIHCEDDCFFLEVGQF